MGRYSCEIWFWLFLGKWEVSRKYVEIYFFESEFDKQEMKRSWSSRKTINSCLNHYSLLLLNGFLRRFCEKRKSMESLYLNFRVYLFLIIVVESPTFCQDWFLQLWWKFAKFTKRNPYNFGAIHCEVFLKIR